MKRIVPIICALFLLCMETVMVSAQGRTLRFNQDKKFKIVQFTDVHWHPGSSDTTSIARRMCEILDKEKPDLVVYTGDVSTGKPAKEAFDKALEPVISRNIPFAVTLGNHDDEQDLTRKELLEYISTKPGNLTTHTEGIYGVTNYVLPVKSVKGDKDEAVLYMIDSNSYSTLKQVKGYGWMSRNQIEWYEKRSAGYTERNNGTPLPALAFFHIPLPEYNEAAADENTKLTGTRMEKACAPQINTGMFSAMLHAGDVMATFVGHDHVNDYAAYWKGILLCYGRYSGSDYSSYGRQPGGSGARVIELTEGVRGFKSWISLRNGTIINVINFPDDFQKR